MDRACEQRESLWAKRKFRLTIKKGVLSQIMRKKCLEDFTLTEHTEDERNRKKNKKPT